MAARPFCLLLLLVAASGVLAKPKDTEAPPTLDITSSFALGHPLLGDTLGPFPSSTDVTLTCSSKDSSLLLSWWEGDHELVSLDANVGDQGTGRSISLEALYASDSGRRLTCKAKGTELEKTVTLQVTGAFDIIVNGKTLEKGHVSIDVRSGDDMELTCLLQGYDMPVPSWFVDNSELEAQSEKSPDVSSSVLALPTVSLLDSGRRYTCRSEGGVPERVVEILVHARERSEKEDVTDNTVEILQIFLICVCVGGVIMIVVMVTVVVRLVRDYKQAVRCQQVSKVSDIFKKYSRLSNVNGSSQDAFAPHLARGPYKPCSILIDAEGSE